MRIDLRAFPTSFRLPDLSPLEVSQVTVDVYRPPMGSVVYRGVLPVHASGPDARAGFMLEIDDPSVRRFLLSEPSGRYRYHVMVKTIWGVSKTVAQGWLDTS